MWRLWNITGDIIISNPNYKLSLSCLLDPLSWNESIKIGSWEEVEKEHLLLSYTLLTAADATLDRHSISVYIIFWKKCAIFGPMFLVRFKFIFACWKNVLGSCNHDGPGLKPGRWPFDASNGRIEAAAEKASCHMRAADSCGSSDEMLWWVAFYVALAYLSSAKGQECRLASPVQSQESRTPIHQTEAEAWPLVSIA